MANPKKPAPARKAAKPTMGWGIRLGNHLSYVFEPTAKMVREQFPNTQGKIVRVKIVEVRR